jgi:hypothetical protein
MTFMQRAHRRHETKPRAVFACCAAGSAHLVDGCADLQDASCNDVAF